MGHGLSENERFVSQIRSLKRHGSIWLASNQARAKKQLSAPDSLYKCCTVCTFRTNSSGGFYLYVHQYVNDPDHGLATFLLLPLGRPSHPLFHLFRTVKIQ